MFIDGIWAEKCPFCDCNDLFFQYDDMDYRVSCDSCGVIGPSEVTPEIAIKAWNNAPRNHKCD